MRFFIIFIICCLEIFANDEALQQFDENNNRIFELFADNIDALDYKITIATGNATIISQDVYILADYIKYNTETKEAQINGNVKIYRDGTLFFSTQSASVKFNEKYYLIEPFYMQDSSSGMWISARMAQSKDKDYELKDIMVSGCDITSPIWRIEGTSGSYNEDSAIASIWNPRIFIKSVPVMYLPYIFVSTKNERTSGLLYPELATSTLDGFIYMQPIFLALQDFWDMTFSPQVRWKRGFGMNAQARVVDINQKMFELNAGIFYNFNKYVRDYNIKNQYTFGFNFKHERDNLLDSALNLDGDGLFLDFRYMNDLDYIRLQSTKNVDIENRIQTSKANYFGHKDNHFFGLSFKYFLDLSKLDNSDTFQTLPQFQYHKQLEQFVFKNLLYAVDIKNKSIVRSRGFGYLDNSISIPFYLQTSIFSGYMTIGASADLNAGLITLHSTNSIANKIQDKNSIYFSTNYGFFASSDIAKQWDKVFHTMSFGATFTSPLYRYYRDKNGVFEPQNSSIPEISTSFSNINIVSQTKQQLQLKFSQYFFGLDNIEYAYHRMSQDVNLFDKKNILGSLRNDLGIAPISNIDLMTTLFYSHKYQNIEEASVSLNTYYGDFRAALTYFFKANYDITDGIRNAQNTSNFLRVKLSHDFGYFSLYGNIGFDFKEKYVRDWDIMISKDIRCFGIGLRFANEIVPMLTTSGSRTIRNNFVSLEFRFVPVTQTSLSYRFGGDAK